MVGGKPKALAKYQDAEEKKEAEAAQLQLACAETPLSLDITTLQTAYDSPVFFWRALARRLQQNVPFCTDILHFAIVHNFRITSPYDSNLPL